LHAREFAQTRICTSLYAVRLIGHDPCKQRRLESLACRHTGERLVPGVTVRAVRHGGVRESLPGDPPIGGISRLCASAYDA
jgi:hypothetical protein